MDGVAVFEHEHLGAVVQATKDFAVGEVIFTERPFLKFPDAGVAMQSVFKMSKENQQVFFSFPHFRDLEDSAVKAECKEYYQDMWENAKRTVSVMENVPAEQVSRKIEEVFRIFSVCAFNCLDIPSGYAISRYASTLTHSCLPNAVFSGKHKDDNVAFVAIRPITVGDVITYDWGDRELVTRERRLKLLKARNFFCVCEKCRDPDFSRGALCCFCHSAAGSEDAALRCVKFCSRPDESAEESWICQNCGDTSPVDAKEEAKWALWLKTFSKVVKHVQPTAQHVIELEQKIIAAREALARTNQVVLNMSTVLVALNISIAEYRERQHLAASHCDAARVAGIVAIFDCIQIRECVESGCSGGPDCASAGGHAPSGVPTAVHDLMSACVESMKLPHSPLQYRCAALAAKYDPLMEALYGPRDSTLLSIRHWHRQLSTKPPLTSQCGNPDCKERNCGYFPLLDCSRCLSVAYCNRASQKAHWKVHKTSCQPKK